MSDADRPAGGDPAPSRGSSQPPSVPEPPRRPTSPRGSGPPGIGPTGERRPTEPAGAPRPTEPVSPIDRTDRRSPAWLGGWALSGLAGLGIGVWSLLHGWPTEMQALSLTVPFLATAIVLHHLVATEDAGELTRERRELVTEELPEDRLAATLGRRPVLVRVAVALVVAGGIAVVAGLRWLGPRRRGGSDWAPGVAVVTSDGDRLRPEDVPEGGVVTVWPQDAIDVERSAVMLIRLRQPPLAPTDLDGVVDDRLVAYSKICTHAGCPVALFRDRDQALFCPCHQATFDARRAATPTFGPASRPLPQLPLEVGDDGHLVARDDFDVPPGPRGGEV